MNTQNYWWQVVKVNGEFKVKIYDMENGTSVYLGKEAVNMMSMDLDKSKSQSGIYHIQEEMRDK
jgi:hypothetical protein